MRDITFIVPTVPFGQPRQRHRIMNIGGRAVAKNYTPADSPANVCKAAIRVIASSKWIGATSAYPIAIEILAIFPRPQSMVWKKRPMPRAWKASKPDNDNIEKLVFDALNKLVFRDDSQIVQNVCSKFIAAGDEQPHLQIRIKELTNEDIQAQERV